MFRQIWLFFLINYLIFKLKIPYPNPLPASGEREFDGLIYCKIKNRKKRSRGFFNLLFEKNPRRHPPFPACGAYTPSLYKNTHQAQKGFCKIALLPTFFCFLNFTTESSLRTKISFSLRSLKLLKISLDPPSH